MAEAIGDLVKNNIAEKIRKTAYVNSLNIAKTNRDIKREIHIVRKKTPNYKLPNYSWSLWTTVIRTEDLNCRRLTSKSFK